jgi:coiled-coil domain-containing protein 63/114
LEKANQRFNESVACNKTLREQIDQLRRERVIFDNVYKRLEKELINRRKDVANVIEIANSAYEERDRA